MRLLLASLIVSFLAVGAIAGGGSGGGGGVDILPEWLVAWAEDNDEDVCAIMAYIGGRGGYSGIQVPIAGHGIDVTVTFGPLVPPGQGQGPLQAVLVTGSIDGNAINQAGWAVAGPDGKLRIKNPDLGSGGFRMCDPSEFGFGYCYHGHWRLDPAEFGDGNEFDDVCGAVDSFGGGIIGNPHGRRITTH